MRWFILDKRYVFESHTADEEGYLKQFSPEQVIEMPPHLYHPGYSKWDLEDLWLKHHKVFIYRRWKDQEVGQWVGVRECKNYLMDSFPLLTWKQIIEAMKRGEVETQHAYFYVKPF